MQTLLIMYLFGGMLLVALSLPMIAGRIKPNPYYGFRVKETLKDESVWYRVNRFAGLRFLLTGLLFCAAVLGLYQIPALGIDGYAYACLAVFVLLFSAGIWQSWKYLKSLSK